METFLPHDPWNLAFLSVLLVAEMAVGFLLQRNPRPLSNPAAWVMLALCTLSAHLLLWGEPAGFRMLAIIGTLFLGMKGVVATQVRGEGAPALGTGAWLAFTCMWPGMDPSIFQASPRARRGGLALAGAGALCTWGSS